MKSIIGKNFKFKSFLVEEINESEFRVKNRVMKQKNAKTIARFLEKRQAKNTSLQNQVLPLIILES